MICDEARRLLLDLQRGRLASEAERALRLHLDGCAACAQARAEEEVLTELLERRLPRYPAPAALKGALAALAPALAIPQFPSSAARGGRRWAVAPALAAAVLALALVLGVALGFGIAAVTGRSAPGDALAALASEAVSDHLRVLLRDRAVDVESGETHQVKPWFEGKLDFAPAVPAPVSPDMRLEGGAVGYLVDRRAAVLVYRLRRHLVTLLAFRTDGLLPDARDVAGRQPSRRTLRGFEVFLWSSGELSYALVGDVDAAELSGIAGRLAQETRSR